jgi:NDP-sugar pyrophosphorylase family protein
MQAIILCGGKGERLKPLTNSVPKPLVEVNKQPIVVHVIKHLMKHGIEDIILATGDKSEKFENYFKAHDLGCSITLIDSGEVDIIKRIEAAKNHIVGSFLVLYGDTISDVNISDLIAFHNAGSNEATMTVFPLETQFGLVDISNKDKVIGFKEKPRLDKWINIGYFCYEKSVLDCVSGYKSHEEFLAGITNKGILTAFRHEGIHFTINTLGELEEAEKKIKELY